MARTIYCVPYRSSHRLSYHVSVYPSLNCYGSQCTSLYWVAFRLLTVVGLFKLSIVNHWPFSVRNTRPIQHFEVWIKLVVSTTSKPLLKVNFDSSQHTFVYVVKTNVKTPQNNDLTQQFIKCFKVLQVMRNLFLKDIITLQRRIVNKRQQPLIHLQPKCIWKGRHYQCVYWRRKILSYKSNGCHDDVPIIIVIIILSTLLSRCVPYRQGRKGNRPWELFNPN